MKFNLQKSVPRTASFFRSALLATALLATSVTASAQVVLSNLDQNWVANLAAFGSFYSATAFTPGGASETYALSAVSMQIEVYKEGSGFYLALYSDNAGLPGDFLEKLSGTDAPGYGTYTYTSSGFILEANVNYWLLAGSSGDGQFGWAASNTPAQGEWSADSLSLSSFDGGETWASFGNYYARYSLEASAVSAIPEPSTYAAIFGGLALGGAMLWRRRKQA